MWYGLISDLNSSDYRRRRCCLCFYRNRLQRATPLWSHPGDFFFVVVVVFVIFFLSSLSQLYVFFTASLCGSHSWFLHRNSMKQNNHLIRAAWLDMTFGLIPSQFLFFYLLILFYSIIVTHKINRMMLFIFYSFSSLFLNVYKTLQKKIFTTLSAPSFLGNCYEYEWFKN